MNLGLPFSSNTLRHAAAMVGIAAALNLAAEPADKAKVSSKEGSEAAIAPATAPEREEGLHLPGRSSSSITGIDLPPPSTSSPGQTLDPKARRRLLQDLDRRRNWMFDDKSSGSTTKAGDRAKGKSADGRKDEDKSVEFESSRQRSLMEKRIAGEDDQSRSEKADKEEQETKDRKKSDPTRKDRDDQESDGDGDTRTAGDSKKKAGSETERDRDNRPFQQAIFSDPFTPARADSEDASKSSGLTSTGPRNAGPDSLSSRPGSERNDGFLNRTGPAGAKTDAGFLSDFGGPHQTHAQQFNDILGGGDNTASARSGLLDAPKAAPKPFSQGPGAFGGIGASPSFSLPGNSAFSTPAAPRPTSPSLKPQPGILPFPPRGF